MRTVLMVALLALVAVTLLTGCETAAERRARLEIEAGFARAHAANREREAAQARADAERAEADDAVYAEPRAGWARRDVDARSFFAPAGGGRDHREGARAGGEGEEVDFVSARSC